MTILQSAIAQAAGTTSYQIARSLRFNSADSAYLNRTPASASNRKTWTWSGWVKRGLVTTGTFKGIFTANNPNVSWFFLGFSSGNTIDVSATAGSSASWSTTALFRDPSAYYHIVLAVDTTSATSTMNGSATDRFRLYVNGVQYVITGGTVPTQNSDLQVNNNVSHTIGGYSSEYYDGYMTEINFIDGQALTPSSFGETSATTGVWNPIDYTGTYGTNGFYLNFSDNSNTTAATLGKDYSGNSNNYTPNNFSVTAGVGNDSLTDTPTNYGTDTGIGGSVRGNYCTLNPLDRGSDVNTVVNGNLDATWTSNNGHSIRSTISVSSGKWYWECTNVNNLACGVIQQQLKIVPTSGGLFPGGSGFGVGGSYSYFPDSGNKYTNGTATAYGATFTTTDVIGCALDMDNGKIYWSKNGTWQASGDPAAGTNAAYTGISGTFSPAWGYQSAGNNTLTANFGQRAFAYTAPSGFKALCSQNFATPAIGASSTTLANQNFDATLYTGTGASLSVTNAGAFQPDWVWLKSRSNAQDHKLTDVLRGVTKAIISNSSGTETTDTNGLTAFNSTGFTVGSDSNYNTNAATYVGWQWKGGGTGVSNTSGSITSTVSANPTSGFSAVTYTGNGSSGATFGHGLGVVPRMIIFKCRDTAYDWLTYHVKLGNTAFVALNSFAAQTTGRGDFLNSTTPSSSLVTLGNTAGINESTKTYVAYCFAEVAGFSKFDSYVGNSSTDGPFIYCGFRPRFLVVKSLASAGWYMVDAARNAYNVMNGLIFADFNNAEGSNVAIDFLSNGFKLRGTQSEVNAGDTYIYMAFAESPFNYARAR